MAVPIVAAPDFNSDLVDVASLAAVRFAVLIEAQANILDTLNLRLEPEHHSIVEQVFATTDLMRGELERLQAAVERDANVREAWRSEAEPA